MQYRPPLPMSGRCNAAHAPGARQPRHRIRAGQPKELRLSGALLQLYIRWVQDVRRFKTSTASRGFAMPAGFYWACIIGGGLEHSPAEHVRRPWVLTQSSTSGFMHGSSTPRPHPHMQILALTRKPGQICSH